MKLTLNSTNNSLLNFQNLFNKSLNSINNKNEYKGKNEKTEKENVKKRNYCSISAIKKKSYKIRLGKK